jgi:hypothetical protein
METSLYHNLKQIRVELPRLADILKLDAEKEIGPWAQVIDARLLARFDPAFPLVAAICGGGSSGKSTLFNSLMGARYAPTGGRAGMNRRVLVSIPPELVSQSACIAALVEPFGEPPALLKNSGDLLEPGGPLYVAGRPTAADMILLDTPDFDTGARGRYSNRDSARSALEAADILIYVFTNSNYNNRDNTDFIARMLTGIGRRKCFLVYRCYPSFTAEEVAEHAMTVGRNIYGDAADRYVLGVFRVDEDNRIAAGDASMTLRPVGPGALSSAEALRAIDLPQLRFDLHATMLADVIEDAAALVGRAKLSLDELRRYAAALRAAQGVCLQEALSFFPMDRVIRRFAKIWAATDPPAVKFMRRTGNVIELPVRAVFGAAGWAREKLSGVPAVVPPAEQFSRRLEENLVAAATTLHHTLLSPHLSPVAVEGRGTPGTAADPEPPFTVSAHPVVLAEQEKLRRMDFSSILQAILARKEAISRIDRDMEVELREVADHFRRRMGVWSKISQTFWAALNVLPATVAVTYVLSTGDPVGAATIKVKLAGLFGLKDLYALVAIPVTRGMKQADQKQLKAMLGPLAQTWLRHKFAEVQALFEEELSGAILRSAGNAAEAAGCLVAQIEEYLNHTTTGRIR